MGELESIEDVLAAHVDWSAGGGSLICACDEKLRDLGGPVDLADCEEIHRAHLADAIRAHLAEVAGRDETGVEE